MASRKVPPARAIVGSVTPPGDKSISHRYAMLAALAEGTSELRHFSASEDCRSTLGCLRALGAGVEVQQDRVRITGRGLRGLRSSWRALDARNSGTTMRLLAGILAGQPFSSKIKGDRSLERRPMRRVIEPLRQMGAEIRARDGDYAPLEVRGGNLKAIEYSLPVPSAQVKSAILLAGLFAEGMTCVSESVRTRDHTEIALEQFGARIVRERHGIRVHGIAADGSAYLQPKNFDVPGDLSSAVFFIAAALLLPGSNLMIQNVGLNPTRTAVLDVLSSMGAHLSVVSLESADGELVGDIAVRPSQLSGGVIEGNQIAQLIDELPVLVALGPFTEQGMEIRDARELRVKESDRIETLVQNLRRMGARVEERPDGLRVEGRGAGPLRGAEIDPRGDHRIAMGFAVAALAAQGETLIRDAECAAVSYPEFFSELERLAER